ncbi:MAG: hypothetical protein K5868_02280 [Lachnospiraceae bacterium]|nr:hypothetical protein [Lachnospiraceae bacterium]
MGRIKEKTRFIKRVLLVQPTRVKTMGKRLFVLLNAPSANLYIRNKSIQDMFGAYDLAVVNYMPVYAYKEFCDFKPRYWILIDPGLYFENDSYNSEKRKIEDVLSKIDWECSIVTNQFADFNCRNDHIDYIRLPFYSAKRVSKYNVGFAKRNIIAYGMNNVAHASLFFGITFGYKHIALLGLEYKMWNAYMDEKGLVFEDNEHFYDKKMPDIRYSYAEINKNKHGILVGQCERDAESLRMFKKLRKYADIMGSEIVNYSPHSRVEFFLTKPIMTEE